MTQDIYTIRFVIDEITEFITNSELEIIEFDFSDSVISNVLPEATVKIEEFIAEVPHLSEGISKYYTRDTKPNKIMFDDGAVISFKRNQIAELQKFSNLVVQYLSDVYGFSITKGLI